MKSILLGCIADDFTGATDLANNLVRSGMRVVQTIGVPDHALQDDVDAVVVALKSRTIPAGDAVRQSLDALRWLRGHDARQIYFKYCSTFDSTSAGNIGPVTEALMDALDTDFTVATPAFPDNARTVFEGHLFVAGVLLDESGMQNHPLTPMRDPNLVRVMQAQSRRRVGLIDYRAVASGPRAIHARIEALRGEGAGIAIVDAIANDDLLRLGEAVKGMPLVTAGSGLAIGLPQNFGIVPSSRASQLPAATGTSAIVSGSCSVATNRQVRAFIAAGGAAFAVDPVQVAAGVDIAGSALQWAGAHVGEKPILVYSTADAAAVEAVQRKLGASAAGALVERVLAAVAAGLVSLGVRRMIVAGGETAGACVQALRVTQLAIGPQIDPGVPWCHARSDTTPAVGLHVALKSGNFGGDDFFTRAFALLR